MERAATDIYTFARLREDGFTYVDKTDALYAMASGEVGAQFFIARPRRFGKSLAVSTLKSLFEGKPITLIGIAFSTKKRNVSSVKIVRDISQLDCKKSSVYTVHCG